MTAFQLELVSPEKLLLSKPVVMVTLPGGEGDYGVLAGHAPMITTLRPGVINVYESDETTISERLFVSGGFAEVSATRCAILAEEAVAVSSIDRAAVVQALAQLHDDIALAKSDAERMRLEKAIEAAQVKLACVEVAAAA
ncbi:MAG: ATP synthase F1 subunit epsilon [Alphaproteobacteria bacterium]|nr:ATP synthase F1 subunit epsilon [Alphaproteobacteria bacterium]